MRRHAHTRTVDVLRKRRTPHHEEIEPELNQRYKTVAMASAIIPHLARLHTRTIDVSISMDDVVEREAEVIVEATDMAVNSCRIL